MAALGMEDVIIFNALVKSNIMGILNNFNITIHRINCLFKYCPLECLNDGYCNELTGKCTCPPGYGGI